MTTQLEGFLEDLAAFRAQLDDWDRRQLDAIVARATGFQPTAEVTGHEAVLEWDPTLPDRMLAFADRLRDFRERLNEERRVVYFDPMLAEAMRDELVGLLNEGVAGDEDDVYGLMMADRRWWEDYTPEELEQLLWENPDLRTDELEAAQRAWREAGLVERVTLGA